MALRALLEEGLGCVDAERRAKVEDKLADMVVRKELALNALVDALGAQLTADDDGERSRGTEILAETIARALGSSRDALEASALRALAAFFAERLDDVACQPHVLRGLSALAAAASPFGACFGAAQECAALAAGVAARVAPATLSPESRRQAVEVVAIAATRAQPTGAAAFALARGLRRLYVGDRDPRVLLTALSLTARLCRAAGPAPLAADGAKELFDAFSCYFPVLFVPRLPEGTDPSVAVSKDELVSTLRLCFASNPAFAPLALPFLLDKTASSIAAARADALLTLAACVRAYGGPAGCGADFPDRALTALRANSLSAGDSEAVVSAAVSLATAIAETFDNKTLVPQLVDDPLLKTLCAEDIDATQLVDVDDALAAKRMLPALLATPAGAPVAEKAMAELAKHCCGTKDHHIRALGTIADFASVLVHSPSEAAAAAAAAATTTAPVLKIVCDACVAALKAAPTTTAVIAEASRGIGAVAHSPDQAVLEDNEAFVAGIRALTHIAADSSADITLEARAAAALGLTNIGSHRPDLINSHALPTLLVASFAPATTERLALRTLPPLCAAHPDLFNAISTAVLTALESSPPDTALITTLAECCRDSAALAAKDAPAPAVAAHTELLLNTAQHIASVAIDASASCEASADAVLTACRAVVRSVTEGIKTQPERQLSLVRMLRPLFFTAATEDVPASLIDSAIKALPLFCTAVAACDNDAAPELAADIVPLQQAAESGKCAAAAMAVASVVAKLPCESVVVAEAAADALRSGQPLLLAWIARALLLRDHSRAQELLLALVALCDSRVGAAELVNVAVGRMAVDAEGGLGCTDDKLGARGFAIAFDPLLAMHERDTTRAAPLTALAHVVAAAPRDVLEREAARCVPAALRALLHMTRESATATVAMVSALATAAPALLGGDALDGALKRLCDVATHPADYPARARAAALNALHVLRFKLPEYRTLPYQRVVVAGLLPALDDPKRAVRAIAVKCRNAWIIF